MARLIWTEPALQDLETVGKLLVPAPADGIDLYPVSTDVNNVRNGEFDEWSFMVNVLYDIPLTDKLDLNIGVGAGADLADFDDSSSVNDDDWNFAYQGIVGLSYALNDRLDLTLTYRYLNVDSPSFSGDNGWSIERYDLDDVEKHSVTVGLRWDLHEDETPVVSHLQKLGGTIWNKVKGLEWGDPVEDRAYLYQHQLFNKLGITSKDEVYWTVQTYLEDRKLVPPHKFFTVENSRSGAVFRTKVAGKARGY